MNNALNILLICLMFIIICKTYKESNWLHLTCKKSVTDGIMYCVRKTNNIDNAVELLSTMNLRLGILIKHMKETYPNHIVTKRINEGYNANSIQETLPFTKDVAFSENKGEKLAFCLRRNKKTVDLVDINTLMFVALHEISHIATVSIGHTDEFWINFKFLLTEAISVGIYDPIDYSKSSVNFCGMDINSNPYFS